MHIGPHSPAPHHSPLSNMEGSQTQAAGNASKLHQAGQFLSRSVKSLGSSLKSGFVSTYNWAKKTGSKLWGESKPLGTEEKATLEKEKQSDKDYSRKMIDQSFNL